LLEATPDGLNMASTAEIFAGKKIVLFGVPGAFTPTCHVSHLPGYIEHRDAILAKGVDDIAVLSVNDGHVMAAWAKNTGAEGKIRFLADWNAAFSKAMGMDQDMSAGAMGIRSKRYSMIIEDGVVTAINMEELPRQAVTSGAEAIIEQL
tara:strand:- start:197502 stop:197948 length:447 start_codon:yes stop_codon:yes gene_type:complete